MRIRETVNEYGTPIVEYRCESCGELFTICPAPSVNKDGQWTGCMAPECASYDPDRDVDKWFSEGFVKVISNDDGSSRLVPFRSIKGGKDLLPTPPEPL